MDDAYDGDRWFHELGELQQIDEELFEDLAWLFERAELKAEMRHD